MWQSGYQVEMNTAYRSASTIYNEPTEALQLHSKNFEGRDLLVL